ncbi:eukaryotic translation initiation factor 5B-like isoform X2 [Athalia rosae]|nr:eukaryotic translation initiation factor 5B-like isoform X2 [Athalia rosae]
MPPPPGTLPPPPHVFGPVHSQVTPMQPWSHPPPPWQWMTPQTPPLPQQSARDLTPNNFQRDMPLRNNYIRRDRFTHNRNNIYNQRNNFHRKNRRHPRYDPSHGQFDQTSYFGPTVPIAIGLDWQRNSYSANPSVHPADGLINHISVAIQNHQIPQSSLPPGVSHGSINRHMEESGDQDIKIVSEEVVVKKNKQRKPMSQSYPSRPWNREDAERALQIENEYNKTVKAQSLIIKFPDPDLNKDIVREFHSGIQNIHFQSPSGPRYCFIQMAEDVNIDDAIKELEKIPFGVGRLKVERKSLRDEDNPTPEEIDPYTLYIGNLPESVNVNEVKTKFPSAARVDVGYAQKMRNTRYAFIRYNSVEESISAYKQAHDLMWDTRSIIVRFRRQRGNTCLPGEPKPNLKKVKEEPGTSSQVKKEQSLSSNVPIQKKSIVEQNNHTKLPTNTVQEKSRDLQLETVNSSPFSEPSSTVPVPVASAKATNQCMPQPWTMQPTQTSPLSEAVTVMPLETGQTDEQELLIEIKEEPEDYDEMEMQDDAQIEDEMDDDDDEEEDDDSDDDEEDADNDEEEDEEDEEEEEIDDTETLPDDDKQNVTKEDEPVDHLDQMFNDLENMAGDIVL